MVYEHQWYQDEKAISLVPKFAYQVFYVQVSWARATPKKCDNTKNTKLMGQQADSGPTQGRPVNTAAISGDARQRSWEHLAFRLEGEEKNDDLTALWSATLSRHDAAAVNTDIVLPLEHCSSRLAYTETMRKQVLP